MTKEFHLQFSQEELLYLLRSLGLPDLPGMGENPWGHIPNDQAVMVLETAGRGLVAREIVKVRGAQVIVDKRVVQVLSVSAYPQQMVILTYNRSGPAENHNFYRGKDYDIEHSLPYPWIHEFRTIPVSDMGFGIIRKLVTKSKIFGATRSCIVQQAKLNEIRNISVQSVDLAAKRLEENGLPVAEAQQLARVLATPSLKLLVQAVYQLSGDIRQSMFSILSDVDSNWLIGADKPGGQLVQIMALDGAVFEKIISAAYQPFSKIGASEKGIS